ncbi:MAG: hypothetical protein K5905_14690 [Roseibium sp.]|uniref:hypothetical protein n=1 Tax=Roseibium sp. TaxID=1936156 RepID=UPI002602DDB2|nr:hypothetical protein [Roseibium sp.]MCV0426714.1 hypothetical protein [Roseibium sp.]
MNIRGSIISVIMLAALLGLAVLMFNVPIGIEPKTFGALAFGAILVFGVVNLFLVFMDSQNDQKNKK